MELDVLKLNEYIQNSKNKRGTRNPVTDLFQVAFSGCASADSGTFVLSTMTSNGDINPSKRLKIVWDVLEVALVVDLLLAGCLKPLQNISIVAVFLFVFIMILAIGVIVKELMNKD